MIDMSTTVKRENSLSPTPIVKSEVAATKKSTFFSIDQILGKREAEMCGDEVFDKEDGSDAESYDEKIMMDYNNVDDEDLTDTESDLVDDSNNNTTTNMTQEDDIDKSKDDKDNKNDKTTPSYTAIIAQAILSSNDKKLPLGCIYDYIAQHFPEFLKKGQGWRNCVRHNLSLSECFIKAGRARNGRGNYWGIHPRYLKNFSKGDFRKRRASHRPRNRDLSLIGYGMGRYYPYYYNPYSTSQGYSKSPIISPSSRSGFSMDNILSKEQQQRNNEANGPPIISPYKPTWNTTSRDSIHPIIDGSRKTRVCSPPTLSSIVPSAHTFLEHYNYSNHHHHHQQHYHHRSSSSYEYGRSRTTECSCRSYACPSSSTGSRSYAKH